MTLEELIQKYRKEISDIESNIKELQAKQDTCVKFLEELIKVNRPRDVQCVERSLPPTFVYSQEGVEVEE